MYNNLQKLFMGRIVYRSLLFIIQLLKHFQSWVFIIFHERRNWLICISIVNFKHVNSLQWDRKHLLQQALWKKSTWMKQVIKLVKHLLIDIYILLLNLSLANISSNLIWLLFPFDSDNKHEFQTKKIKLVRKVLK